MIQILLLSAKGSGSWEDLAEKSGYEVSTLRKWWHGSRIPSVEAILILDSISDSKLHLSHENQNLYLCANPPPKWARTLSKRRKNGYTTNKVTK